MADTDTEDDVEVKPQQNADASAAPAAPPPGPSEFSASQTPWENPFTKMAGALPTPDYKQALANKQIRSDQEIGAVEGQTQRMSADNARLGAAAEAKNAQIQAVDPNQMTTWNAAEKQKQYSTSPFEAFGSFGMIAVLGMSAFTRAPMTASLNAMAGFMNGIKEGNDQAYDRDYAAWKANNDVFQKRFDVLKSQMTSDMEVWKTKGEQGKLDLSNTMLKYGLYKQKALLDAGLDDVVQESMTKQIQAVHGMAKASQEIEDQHALVEGVKQEQARRTALGLQPMTPIETMQFKADAVKAATPEQRAQQQEWTKLSNSEEYLKASPAEKAAMWVKFRDGEGKTGASATMVSERYEKGKAEYLATHPELEGDAAKIPAKELNRIAVESKAFKPESAAATRKTGLYEKMEAEAVAKNGGQPLNAAQEKILQSDVNRREMTEGTREKLRSSIGTAVHSEEVIDKLEAMMAKNNMIVGLGGKARAPLETLGNITHLWNATDRAQFNQYLNILRQWEPRLLTESHGRPLAAEENKVAAIVPGLEAGATVQNTVDRLRNLKSLMRQLRTDWTARYEGTWTPPAAGPTTPTGSGTPLWQTGTPVQ